MAMNAYGSILAMTLKKKEISSVVKNLFCKILLIPGSKKNLRQRRIEIIGS